MANELWCRHFNGVQHEECEAGVTYRDVIDETTRPSTLPCHGEICATVCTKFEHYTAEEIADHAAQVSKAVKHLLAFQRREITDCPHCGRAVDYIEQVGRSVYTSCGCRLWQGKVPEAWR